MQGFFLGLANGTSCLAQCAPILIPYFLSAGGNAHKNLGTLLQFLGGRLLGYLLFALLAWTVSGLLLATGRYQNLLVGATYIGLSALLLAAVFRKKPPISDVWFALPHYTLVAVFTVASVWLLHTFNLIGYH